MRISDWSSDVCSSDLNVEIRDAPVRDERLFAVDPILPATPLCERFHIGDIGAAVRLGHREGGDFFAAHHRGQIGLLLRFIARQADRARPQPLHREGEIRSEEQPSELQSLMRISYAVFCLKKNKYNNI